MPNLVFSHKKIMFINCLKALPLQGFFYGLMSGAKPIKKGPILPYPF